MSEEKLLDRFHFSAGAVISGKIFAEYCQGLKELFDTKVKGEPTRLNRVVNAEASAIKCVDVLSVQLKAIGVELNIAENEVDNLEGIIHAIVQLDTEQQRIVMNLIKCLKDERKTIQNNEG